MTELQVRLEMTPGRTWEDVQAELCDVVVSVLVALRTLTPDAPTVFAGHLARVADRSLGAGHPDSRPA
ncbi:hypothetical protein [Streptomyces sp. IBSBF 2806]|uniref:hypothetical protein n=1 Tax=Streptomyces sp. IBSBF 2806 TaxID=2903529 RepID=UPI002FDC0287